MGSSVKVIAISIIIFMLLAVIGIVSYGNEQEKAREAVQLSEENTVEIAQGSQAGMELVGEDTRAFLKDDTFFDADSGVVQPSYTVPAAEEQAAGTQEAEMPEAEGKEVSLLMTSVAKDLRVRIVDSTGKLEEGTEFCITLNQKDEYKDEDKNGVIYIENLSAGEYEVALKPVSGYKVSGGASRITIKQSIEYMAMSESDFLIMTEDKIDAAKEDLEVREAKADADSTEITKVQDNITNVSFGIDVSKWNGDIDWQKVKKAGVDYAIIRLGYRGASTGALVQDPYFEANVKGAAEAGVPIGVYFFTQAVNAMEAVEEASMVLSLCKNISLQYPIFIDTEGAGGNGRADSLDTETRTQVCETFCKTITNAGYKSGVYAARNWLNNNLKIDRLKDFVIWLAEYRDKPLYQGTYHMWQYSSNGSIDGISGRVDLNLSYMEQTGGSSSSGSGFSGNSSTGGSNSSNSSTGGSNNSGNSSTGGSNGNGSTGGSNNSGNSSTGGSNSSGNSSTGGSNSSGNGSTGGKNNNSNNNSSNNNNGNNSGNSSTNGKNTYVTEPVKDPTYSQGTYPNTYATDPGNYPNTYATGSGSYPNTYVTEPVKDPTYSQGR